MAKKKKGRRAALKSFARRGSQAYPQKYRTDKELVYKGGKNYTAGPGKDFANLDAGAGAANTAGKAYIYMNGTLYGTAAGIARAATATSTAGTTLDLTIS